MVGSSRFSASLIILGLFVVFVVLPFTGISFPVLSEAWFSKTYLGVIHLPSLAFIGGSFAVYCLFAPIEVAAHGFARSEVTIEELREAKVLLQQANKPGDRDQWLSRFIRLPETNALIGTVKNCVQRANGEETIRHDVASLTEPLAHRQLFLNRYWNQVASTLPLLGMTGTIAGLLFMFNDTNFSDDRSSQLAGLGVALLTTLYSSLITVLVTKQLSKGAADRLDRIQFDSEEVIRSGCNLTRKVRPRDVQQAKTSSQAIAYA